MGACYISRSFPKCSETELLNKVKSACNEAGYESGHSYSGDWGVKIGLGVEITSKTFNSTCDADEWIDENSDKWGALVAVRVLSAPQNINTKSIDTKLVAANNKLNDLLIETGRRSAFKSNAKPLMDTILERTKSAKSKFRGCASCGSKVATAYLKHTACPVCGSNDFLLTETDKGKFIRLNKKVDAVKAEISELEAKRKLKFDSATKAGKAKNDWFWLVGGWCSS